MRKPENVQCARGERCAPLGSPRNEPLQVGRVAPDTVFDLDDISSDLSISCGQREKMRERCAHLGEMTLKEEDLML